MLSLLSLCIHCLEWLPGMQGRSHSRSLSSKLGASTILHRTNVVHTVLRDLVPVCGPCIAPRLPPAKNETTIPCSWTWPLWSIGALVLWTIISFSHGISLRTGSMRAWMLCAARMDVHITRARMAHGCPSSMNFSIVWNSFGCSAEPMMCWYSGPVRQRKCQGCGDTWTRDEGQDARDPEDVGQDAEHSGTRRTRVSLSCGPEERDCI